MGPLENRDIVIGGRCFRDMDDLEDYCFRFPEFEEAVIEARILASDGAKTSIDTYWIVSALEYGDDNAELPYHLHYSPYVEALIEQDY